MIDTALLHNHSTHKQIKFLTISQEGIQYAATLLGPSKEMSLTEIRKMTKEKMGGILISDVIRQERDMGW